MTKVKENIDENALLSKIINEKVKISDLKLKDKTIFDTAIQALEQRPQLAKKLELKTDEEKKLVITWIKKNSPSVKSLSSKISYLDESKYLSDEKHENAIIEAYLNKLFSLLGENDLQIDTFQSLRNEIMLKFRYSTKKGEEIVYMDKELNMPIYLLAKLDIGIKITDAYAFVKFIDVNLQQINLNMVSLKIMPFISSVLRSSVIKVIGENGTCYYELTKHYNEIEKLLKTTLQDTVKNYGLTVVDSFVINTVLSNGADKIFESQRIEFMQRENNLTLQHKAEVLALENYERKAEIHNKYPNYEVGLTEKEKDNAIDRYIAKEKLYRDDSVIQSKSINLAERDNDVGNIRGIEEPKEDKLPTQTKTPAKLVVATMLGIITFVISIVSFANESVFLGFLFIALMIASVGTLIALHINDKKNCGESVLSEIKEEDNSDILNDGGEDTNEKNM